MKDTICAISTSLGVGAISIIRVSGNEAIKIVNKLFQGDNLLQVDSHTIHYGFIVNNHEKIDEVLVSVMKSPKTFTVEDVVEINCHGGIETTRKVLELLIENGCRLAEPGEFTKRAFLNGRIDLMEAESVMDLINAKNNEARKLAIKGLNGDNSNVIRRLREKLINIIGNIEVNIDYPEYEDVYEYQVEDLNKNINDIYNELNKIIDNYHNSELINYGIKTVIVGRPNVGKSSLLNKLLDEDKAIVTDIPGTTRDIVEGMVNLDNITLRIIDTAGIRETHDLVESIGVQKSLESIDDADLVLVILNNNEELTKEDQELLEKTKNKKRIIVVNKKDLNKKLNINDKDIVYTDTVSLEGIDELKNKIKELFNLEEIATSDYNVLTNQRQISIVKECLKMIDEIKESLNNQVEIDLLEMDLKKVWEKLGELIGETYSEELLDELFSRFCLGK